MKGFASVRTIRWTGNSPVQTAGCREVRRPNYLRSVHGQIPFMADANSTAAPVSFARITQRATLSFAQLRRTSLESDGNSSAERCSDARRGSEGSIGSPSACTLIHSPLARVSRFDPARNCVRAEQSSHGLGVRGMTKLSLAATRRLPPCCIQLERMPSQRVCRWMAGVALRWCCGRRVISAMRSARLGRASPE